MLTPEKIQDIKDHAALRDDYYYEEDVALLLADIEELQDMNRSLLKSCVETFSVDQLAYTCEKLRLHVKWLEVELTNLRALGVPLNPLRTAVLETKAMLRVCTVCGEPGAEECGFVANEVCTTLLCDKHAHNHYTDKTK